MPSAAELYRAWEIEFPATVCHVVIIERGDAEDRLTLTDKPYVDKGVSGVRYHHTYPAPVHCIISDLGTDEGEDGTTYSDLKIIDAQNLFGNLQADLSLNGAGFRVLKGDTRWSLLEESFPYRFVEIYRGQITSVRLEAEGNIIRMGMEHMKVNLDRRLGSIEAPVSYGSVFNVPAILVDSATDKYRFDTRIITSTNGDTIYPRDGGAVLTQGVDHNEVTESSFLKGMIQLLGGPPSKDLTATIPRTGLCTLHGCASEILMENVFDDHPVPSSDVSNFSLSLSTAFCFSADGSTMFHASSSLLLSYNLGTPGVLSSGPASSASYDDSFDISSESYTPKDMRITQSGLKLYVLESGTNIIHQYNLGTADTLSTASLIGTFNVGGIIGSLVTGTFALTNLHPSPDGEKLHVMTERGKVYEISMTGGNISTLNSPVEVLNVKSAGFTVEDDRCLSMDFSPDGTKAIFSTKVFATTYQYTCADPFDLGSCFFSGRAMYGRHYGYLGRSKIIANKVFFSPIDASVYVRDDGLKYLHKFSLGEDANLPFQMFGCNRMSSFYRNYFAFTGGVFYNNETACGEAIDNIVGSVGAKFSINRFGRLYSQISTYPSDFPDSSQPWVPVFQLTTADFLGEAGKFIRHVETEPEVRKISVRYKPNYREQGRAELVTSISEDLREQYGAPYSYDRVNSTNLTGQELVIESVMDNGIEVAYYVGIEEDTPQNYIHEIDILLSSTPLLSEFGLGSIVSIDTALLDRFSIYGKAQVVGRTVNWSKNTQTLTLLSN